MITPRPSYKSGFARRVGEAAHPWAWKGRTGAYCPSLGATGSRLFDWSGSARHATLTNFTLADAWVPSSGRYSLLCDVTNDYVTTGKPLSTFMSASTGTYSVWVRPDSAAPVALQVWFGRMVIADDVPGGGYSGIFQANMGGLDRLWAYNWDGSSKIVGVTYTIGEWVHIAWVHSGGTLSIYKNGVLGGSTAAGDLSVLTGTIDFGGGINSGGVGIPLGGAIDDVAIFNRGLNAKEVWQLYRLGRGGAYAIRQPSDVLWVETIAAARRIMAEGVGFLPIHRPFQGGVGASLYAAAVDPDDDPGPIAIEYRRNRALDGCNSVARCSDDLFELGAESVPKSPRVGFCEQPDAEISIDIPDDWLEQAIWTQVRTFGEDYENETLYRHRRILADAGGDEDTIVRGTLTVIELMKRDGGGLLVRAMYAPSRDGVQPEQFRLVKVSGTGSIADVVESYSEKRRLYEFEATGGTNGVAYTFRIDAEADPVVTTLASAIEFTADSAGPPAVTAAVAVEV